MRKEDAERELTRIPKAEPLVVERESKGRESILSLWKAFATFHPFVKGCARPGMRGKPCASRIPAPERKTSYITISLLKQEKA
ncbi:hypothetical protein [Clostridium merdae]|uniref:hypothetical protein n=1 Tax=Clostridium merdae TaxID=1958780 RepID=UPI000A26CF4B|nr:hypothetical protein [Clostridium merdae]